MRPDAEEILRGVSRSLAAAIMPQLSSPWAQSQLQHVIGLLSGVAAEWDGAADQLMRENEALQQFCRRSSDSGIEDMAQTRIALRDAANLPPLADLRISTLTSRNEELWYLVEPLVERAGRDDLDQQVLAELKSLLRAYATGRRQR
ncbi:MAG: hypothetical protein ACYDCQ_16585 [Dehalococcoidia bacterium]